MSGKTLGITLVILSVCLEAFGQIALKKAAVERLQVAVSRALCALGILLLGSEAAVWTVVLSQLDLSVAFPMAALSFVTTAIFSMILLRERVAAGRWAGIALIVGGTALVAAG